MLTEAPFLKLKLPFLELTQVTTDNGRYYINPKNGNQYQSVTTILREAMDMTWLEKWKEEVGEDIAAEVSRLAREGGTEVHKVMEDFVLGTENNSKLSPFRKKAIRKIKQEFTKNINLVFGVELQLYSDELKAAGTFDLGALYKYEYTIIDYKTSKHYKNKEDISHYFIQASAYARMVKERYNIDVPKILIVMIYGNGEVDFMSEDVANYNDLVDKIFIEGR